MDEIGAAPERCGANPHLRSRSSIQTLRLLVLVLVLRPMPRELVVSASRRSAE